MRRPTQGNNFPLVHCHPQLVNSYLKTRAEDMRWPCNETPSHLCISDQFIPTTNTPSPIPPPPYLLKMHDEQKMHVLPHIISQVLTPTCIGIESLKQTTYYMDNLGT